jgi:hypothetical protein
MLVSESLPFVTRFVDELNEALRKLQPQAGLSQRQKSWLRFCLVAIVVTNSVCWKRFDRASLGKRSHAALSWMFRHAKLFWQGVLRASVLVILDTYGVREGVLVVDDSDHKRSKSTKRIYRAHRLKDKSSGGIINGQSLVVLLLVTPIVTIPVGWDFYMPDPVLTAWNKQEKRLKARGFPKRDRSPKPSKNANYPTKQEIALRLLTAFQHDFSQVRITCVLADTLYGTDDFLSKAAQVCDRRQVISQLRKNQHIRFKTQEMPVETYFAKFPGTLQTMTIRGGNTVTVMVGSARLYVCAHGQKRFVLALKYEGETSYRYLVATELSWRTLDILQAYTVRWLIEVFLQDWKAYEGWGQLTKQPDEEGSRCSLILSLLCDHCLLLHPEQLARLEHKLPACTVGSLCEAIKLESLMHCLWEIVSSEEPQKQFQRLAKRAKEVFTPASSIKHMVGRDLGRLEPTPALEYRARIVLKAA